MIGKQNWLNNIYIFLVSAFTFIACHQLDFEIWRDRECGNWIAQSKCLYRAPPSPKSDKSAANMINNEKQEEELQKLVQVLLTQLTGTAQMAGCQCLQNVWRVKKNHWKCYIMATFFRMREVQVPLAPWILTKIHISAALNAPELNISR